MSQDDDGLEPVYPSQPAGGAESVKTGANSSPAAESVVVDPKSQVASSPTAAPAQGRSPRRQAEPTLVLEGRRVDQLRKQVTKQQRALKRKHRIQAMIWAVAGGVAVLTGGWLASGSTAEDLFSPSQGAEAGAQERELQEFSADQIGTMPDKLQPDAHVPEDGQQEPSAVRAPTESDESPEGASVASATGGPSTGLEERPRAKQGSASPEPGSHKVGQSFDAAARPSSSTEAQASPSSASAPSAQKDNALSLDDLEEE